MEVVEEGWSPERLEGRVLEWRREECLLTITKSPSQPSLLGARVWCAAAMCGAAGLRWGKLGTAVSFTLGVAASYRVEAREARMKEPEVRRVRSKVATKVVTLGMQKKSTPLYTPRPTLDNKLI